MMWLQGFMVLFGLAVSFSRSDRDIFLLSVYGLVILGLLYLIRLGLRQEYVWVAVLFLLICIYDVFGAISDGVNLANLVNLVDAVLSFVAASGIVMWLRQRRHESNEQRIDP